MRRIILACGVTLLGQLMGYASDLRLDLKLNNPTCKLGHSLRFQIKYTNLSAHAIRFLPDAEHYSADVIAFEKVDGTPVGVVIPFGEMSMDFYAMSKGVVVLQPRQSYSRKFDVRLSTTLPPSYDEPRNGLFLWFRGSNIELPALGKYRVVAKYSCGRKHPVARYLVGNPPLWYGEAESAPVMIELN